jgi:hypothetical protein
MNRLRQLIIPLLVLGLGICPGQEPTAATTPVLPRPATDGSVWGALIYASEGPTLELPKTVPAGLKDLDKRLAKVFPFTRFEILGQHTQDIFRQYESWVVPSKDLFLKLDSKGPADAGGINLNLQFWRDQEVLVKTDTVLRPDSPLFIAGPKWRQGRLLFVLLLTKVEAGKK